MKESNELKQKLKEAQEKRSELCASQETMLDEAKRNAPAGKEFKPFEDEAKTKFMNLSSQIEAQNREIERLESELAFQIETEKVNQRQARRQAPPKASEEQKVAEAFSITRAIRIQLGEEKLDGAEREMHEEGSAEAKLHKLDYEGIVIPRRFVHLVNPGKNTGDLKYGQRATLVAGTANALGNAIIDDPAIGIIPLFTPKLVTSMLGATVMTGLTGNVPILRQSSGVTVVWEGEVDTGAEDNPEVTKSTMTPKRAGITVPFSKQLVRQSSYGVDQFVLGQINRGFGIGYDAVYLNGGGTNEPSGILDTAGIGSVVGGANGAIPDWDDFVGLETELAVDNADVDVMAYATTPGIRGVGKTNEKWSGTGREIWVGNEVNGYRAVASTQVPSTLTKGTSVGVCHAIIFAHWADLLIGFWGGLDLVTDIYTGKKEAIVEVTANGWTDCALAHVESFAAMKDALIS